MSWLNGTDYIPGKRYDLSRTFYDWIDLPPVSDNDGGLFINIIGADEWDATALSFHTSVALRTLL